MSMKDTGLFRRALMEILKFQEKQIVRMNLKFSEYQRMEVTLNSSSLKPEIMSWA